MSYFKELRFDKKFHLGLGDIRLTVAMQDEIDADAAALREQVETLTREKEREERLHTWAERRIEAMTAALREAREALNGVRGPWVDSADTCPSCKRPAQKHDSHCELMLALEKIYEVLK